MVQPQFIPSGAHFQTDIAPNETSNTPTKDTQLQPQAQNPHREAADMATKNMYNDQILRIVHKSTTKMNKQKHTVGCTLLNHIKELPDEAI
jgi:hypothetical protein